MHFTVDAAREGYNSEYRLQKKGKWAPLSSANGLEVITLGYAHRLAARSQLFTIDDTRYSASPQPGCETVTVYPQAHFTTPPVLRIDDFYTTLARELRLSGVERVWPALAIDATPRLVYDLKEVRTDPSIAVFHAALDTEDALALVRSGLGNPLIRDVHALLTHGWRRHCETNQRNLCVRDD